MRAELVDLRGASLALVWSPDGSGVAVGIRGPRWHGAERTPQSWWSAPPTSGCNLVEDTTGCGVEDGRGVGMDVGVDADDDIDDFR